MVENELDIDIFFGECSLPMKKPARSMLKCSGWLPGCCYMVANVFRAAFLKSIARTTNVK